MKCVISVVILVIILSLTEAADIQRFKGWLPRSVLYPRKPVPQGKGYFAPKQLTPSHSTKAFCGRSQINDKIVGGTIATAGEFPWQVGMRIDGIYFCGASIIDNRHLLTAAHCVDGTQRLQLHFGAQNINNYTEPGQILVFQAASYTLHPSWNPQTLTGDIAIIRLDNGLEFNDRIQPICLIGPGAPSYAGDNLVATGWGNPSDSAPGISTELRKVTVQGITNTACRLSYSAITDDVLCVSTTGGKGTCNGDSGGPLSFVNNDGTFNQVGVASFYSSIGCEKGIPAGFARVSSYSQWLSENTGLIL